MLAIRKISYYHKRKMRSYLSFEDVQIELTPLVLLQKSFSLSPRARTELLNLQVTRTVEMLMKTGLMSPRL